jgi:ABC-2 type transport system permease protein
VTGDRVDLGVILPTGPGDAGLRVETMAGPDDRGRALTSAIVAAVVENAATGSGRPSVPVEVTTVGSSLTAPGDTPFDAAAAQQLILLIFLKPLLGAAALVTSRRLGVSRRMLATPTRVSTLIVGEGAGQWILAVVQGAYVMVACSLLFGVTWGSVAAAGVLIALLATAATGASLLLAASARSESAASGLTVLFGLGLGLLGGVLVPLGMFNDTMRTLAHVTPHAWAVDAFATLNRGGSLPDVLVEVAVLGGFAVVLVASAAWRFLRVLSRA